MTAKPRLARRDVTKLTMRQQERVLSEALEILNQMLILPDHDLTPRGRHDVSNAADGVALARRVMRNTIFCQEYGSE